MRKIICAISNKRLHRCTLNINLFKKCASDQEKTDESVALTSLIAVLLMRIKIYTAACLHVICVRAYNDIQLTLGKSCTQYSLLELSWITHGRLVMVAGVEAAVEDLNTVKREKGKIL